MPNISFLLNPVSCNFPEWATEGALCLHLWIPARTDPDPLQFIPHKLLQEMQKRIFSFSTFFLLQMKMLEILPNINIKNVFQLLLNWIIETQWKTGIHLLTGLVS